MKIYIAGDTGAEDYVERFMEAEETLTGRGHTVVNMAAMEQLQQETAPGAYGSFVPCHSCVYAQHLFGGGMQCRNLRGLACEVKEDDGCSHGVFPEGSRL